MYSILWKVTDLAPWSHAKYINSVENQGKQSEILCKLLVYYFKIQIFNRAGDQIHKMLINLYFIYAVFFSYFYAETPASSVFLYFIYSFMIPTWVRFQWTCPDYYIIKKKKHKGNWHTLAIWVGCSLSHGFSLSLSFQHRCGFNWQIYVLL